MKNWRYFYVSAPEQCIDRVKHIAVYPLPHLLSMSLAPAPAGDPAGQDLRLMFSTETVKVRGTDLRELWEKLQQARVDPAGTGTIPIPGLTNVTAVEFSQSDP